MSFPEAGEQTIETRGLRRERGEGRGSRAPAGTLQVSSFVSGRSKQTPPSNPNLGEHPHLGRTKELESSVSCSETVRQTPGVVDQPEQMWGKVSVPETQHWTLGMPASSWTISSIMDAKLMEWGCPWGLGPPVPVGSERPGHTASESAAVSKVSSGTTKPRSMAVLKVWLRNLPVTFGDLVLPRFCIILFTS